MTAKVSEERDNVLAETATKKSVPTNFTGQLIWGALESCYDPEIPDANIVELGLVYNVQYDKQTSVAEITMTLTSPHR